MGVLKELSETDSGKVATSCSVLESSPSALLAPELAMSLAAFLSFRLSVHFHMYCASSTRVGVLGRFLGVKLRISDPSAMQE